MIENIEEYLVPRFENAEPDRKLAKIKNDNGLCAFQNCYNILENPPDIGFFEFKICKKCRKRLNETVQKIEKEMNDECLRLFDSII